MQQCDKYIPITVPIADDDGSCCADCGMRREEHPARPPISVPTESRRPNRLCSNCGVELFANYQEAGWNHCTREMKPFGNGCKFDGLFACAGKCQCPANTEMLGEFAASSSLLPVPSHPKIPPLSEHCRWLIFFEDQGRKPEFYGDEATARERYRRLLDNWNCHLFQVALPVGRPCSACQGNHRDHTFVHFSLSNDLGGFCWEEDHYPNEGDILVSSNISEVTCPKCREYCQTLNDLKKSEGFSEDDIRRDTEPKEPS